MNGLLALLLLLLTLAACVPPQQYSYVPPMTGYAPAYPDRDSLGCR
jgi:hypothetical protein